MNILGQYLKHIQENGTTSGWRTQVKRTDMDFKRLKKIKDAKQSKKQIDKTDKVATMSDVVSASNPNINT
jgi:hypothetical protein